MKGVKVQTKDSQFVESRTDFKITKSLLRRVFNVKFTEYRR
ncbi:hypothetical protein AR1Y2_2694 [Anaerostipes rhamnosivorans]|uniref:Uncharacterized protein n=2 Tax=Anaerostipes rhamnosivorans TaxID=1229621 RepID=A0A4P8IEE7_9FIRM|nr:hypothetical protein AR1Y2_2694 [Anaerostipes rhamnosivorans]